MVKRCRKSVSKARKSGGNPFIRRDEKKDVIKVAAWNYDEILTQKAGIKLPARALAMAKASSRFGRLGAPYLLDSNNYLAEDIADLHKLQNCQETALALANSCN